MKKTLIIAMAAAGLALSGPVTAHHPSPMTEFIEGQMPSDALEQHNTMIDEMDPADAARSYEGRGNSDSGSGEVIDDNPWDVNMGDFGPAREPRPE